MTRYNEIATDQYMRSVLVEEFTIDEADNALTALSTLTSNYPRLFPHERTFARPDHDPTVSRTGPAGVRFVVYGEEGIERQVRLPRADLASLKSSIDGVFGVLDSLYKLAG